MYFKYVYFCRCLCHPFKWIELKMILTEIIFLSLKIINRIYFVCLSWPYGKKKKKLILLKLKSLLYFEVLSEDKIQTCSNQMILSGHELFLITYFRSCCCSCSSCCTDIVSRSVPVELFCLSRNIKQIKRGLTSLFLSWETNQFRTVFDHRNTFTSLLYRSHR